MKAAFALILILALPSVAQAEPRYQGLGKLQSEIADQRLHQAPLEGQRLIAALGSRVTIKPSRSSLGGGYYTETVLATGPERYVVYLRSQSLRLQRPFYRHMFWHELGHVLINAYFTAAHWETTIALLEKNPRWRRCFPDPTNSAPGSCVPEEEIIADQIAFWATGRRQVRSPRQIPPLVSRAQFRDLVIRPLIQKIG